MSSGLVQGTGAPPWTARIVSLAGSVIAMRRAAAVSSKTGPGLFLGVLRRHVSFGGFLLWQQLDDDEYGRGLGHGLVVSRDGILGAFEPGEFQRVVPKRVDGGDRMALVRLDRFHADRLGRL